MAKLPPFPREEYDAAVRSEQEDRYLAFLGIERIAGIDVAPLTLQRLAWLNVARSPFIVGGTVDYAAIIQFLWFVSKDFTLDESVKQAFLEQSLSVDLELAAKDINDYIDRAFLDCVGGRPSGGIDKTLACTCATVCAQMADEPFRMDWERCMDVPLSVLFQLMRVNGLRNGAPKVNKRSDAVAARHNEKVSAILKREKAKKMKEAAKHG